MAKRCLSTGRWSRLGWCASTVVPYFGFRPRGTRRLFHPSPHSSRFFLRLANIFFLISLCAGRIRHLIYCWPELGRQGGQDEGSNETVVAWIGDVVCVCGNLYTGDRRRQRSWSWSIRGTDITGTIITAPIAGSTRGSKYIQASKQTAHADSGRGAHRSRARGATFSFAEGSSGRVSDDLREGGGFQAGAARPPARHRCLPGSRGCRCYPASPILRRGCACSQRARARVSGRSVRG